MTARAEWRSQRGSAQVQPAADAGAAPFIPGAPLGDNPLAKPQWTIAFAAVLTYAFVITSIRWPIGQPVVILAALGALTASKRVKMPGAFWLYVAFVLWSLIGFATSPWPDAASKGFTDSLKLVVIVWAAANALRTRPQVHTFMLFYAICYGFFPIRGTLMNYFVYGERSQPGNRAIWREIFGNPNDLAGISILMLSVALALLVVEKRKYLRWGLYASIALLPVIILFTASRGAFIGLAVCVLATLATQKKGRMRALVVTGLVGVIAIAVTPQSAWDRFSTLKSTTSREGLQVADDGGSAEQRYEIWHVSEEIIGMYPVTGVGLGAYPQAHMANSRMGPRDTHSTYLNITAETGFPGAIMWLAIIALTFARGRAARNRYGKVAHDIAEQVRFLNLGLFAFMVAGIWGSYSKFSFLYLQLVLIWRLTDILVREGRARRLAAGA